MAYSITTIEGTLTDTTIVAPGVHIVSADLNPTSDLYMNCAVGTTGDPTNIVWTNSTLGDQLNVGGNYTQNVTGLSPGTAYRYRARARWGSGGGADVYGNTVQVYTLGAAVTTAAGSSVLATTFTGNGSITAYETITRRGFCYKAGASGDPTVADSTAYDDGSFTTGAYTKGITGLTAATAYRVRAYAITATGTYYGTTVAVTTSAIPAVTTQAGASVSSQSFVGNGNITVVGNYTVTRRGFCYVKGVGTPTTSDSVAYDEAASYTTGAYTKSITGLESGVAYSVRAYCNSQYGDVYGSSVTVTTTDEDSFFAMFF